jgi:hypothetical protein
MGWGRSGAAPCGGEVGECPDPTGRRWAAGSSSVTALAGGGRAGGARSAPKQGPGTLTCGPECYCKT